MIKYLKGDYRIGKYKPIDILNYIKIITFFPNVHLAYIIMLIILVLVVSKKSFFKPKLIKSDLRLIIYQQRLNELVLLSCLLEKYVK